MAQIVKLRNGNDKFDLPAILIYNNALHWLRKNYFEVYTLLIDFYTMQGVVIEGDARQLLIDKYLVEVAADGSIKQTEIVRTIIRCSVSESDYYMEALPYNRGQ